VYADSATNNTAVQSYETWLTTDASIEGVISYDALMGGQLDESELPTTDYEDHYVFAGDTKSGSSYPLVDADGNLRRGNVKAAWDVYGHADDETVLLSVLAQANNRFANADNYTAPIDDESLQKAVNDGNTDDSHRLTSDTLSQPLRTHMSDGDNGTDGGGTTPSDPTQFYDGEPTVEDLADDFGAVQMLVDEKEDLKDERDTLNDELTELRRDDAETKAEELAEMTDFWGDSEELLDKYDDGEMTLDHLDEKIAAAESITSTETTTPISGGRDDDDSQFVADRARDDSDREYERTSNGKIDLSNH